MNIVLGIFMMLLPFIVLFGVFSYLDGLKPTVQVFGATLAVIGFVAICAKSASLLLGLPI